MGDFYDGAGQMGDEIMWTSRQNQQAEIQERAQAFGVSLELAEYLLILEERIRELEGKK